MSVVDYSIHYVIMLIMTICLAGSFEFFISELRKSPQIMNPAWKKDE
jgi:hypothetical protein